MGLGLQVGEEVCRLTVRNSRVCVDVEMIMYAYVSMHVQNEQRMRPKETHRILFVLHPTCVLR